MDTSFEVRRVVRKFVTRVATNSGTDTEKLLALGRRQGWNSVIVGRGPLPKEAFRHGDWVVVPIEQDSSEIPQRALERVQEVFGAGIRPRGFVLAHEAPAYLLPGRIEEPPSVRERISELKDGVSEAGKAIAGPAGEIAQALAKAAGVAFSGVAALFLLAPAVVLGLAIGLDPILVAVMEDGYWVAIDQWDI